jgi:hypothetical protein
MDDREDIIPVYPDEAFNRKQKASEAERDQVLREAEFAHLDRIADFMDTKFEIPGTGFRFGIEPLIGLMPVVGNTISLGVSAYILKKAWDHDVPQKVRARMVANVAVEWAIGNVPVVGDMFDAAWKAHRRNVDLLKKHARR